MKSPNEFKEAFATAKQLMAEHQVPVVLEFILERVTNISMGTDLHNVSEFEEILCLDPSLRLDQVSGSALQVGADAQHRRADASARDAQLERGSCQLLEMVDQTGRRCAAAASALPATIAARVSAWISEFSGKPPASSRNAYQNRRDRLWITPMLLARTELCAARGTTVVDRAGRMQVADRVGRGGGGADLVGEQLHRGALAV